MDSLQSIGRRMVFWGALLLLGWAVYELGIRFEEMLTWLSPVYRLVQDRVITFWDYLSRLNWARLRTHLFLVVCILFAVYALVFRRRVFAGLIAIPLAVLMIIFSLGSTPLMAASFWQKLKLVPLMLVALGNLLILIPALGRKNHKRQHPQSPHSAQPYDPFKINRQ